MNKIKWPVILIVLATTGTLYNCNQPAPTADDRKGLISLADLALDKKTNDSSQLASLVTYDKDFYMAFFKTELGKEYFYSRHGSCCPCNAGGMSCCECSGGSGFGGPDGIFGELRGINPNPSFVMLTSNKSGQPTTLKLDKKSIGGMAVFLIPPSTPVGKYTVQFQGRVSLEMEIEVINAEGNFDIISFH
jgi:hypothetical protein